MPRRFALVAALLVAPAGSVRAQSPDSAASPFRPLACPRRTMCARARAVRGGVLAAARGLSHPGHAQPRATRARRARDDPLRQPESGSAALSLGVSRAEHLRARQRHQQAQPAAARLPRLHVRLLVQGLRRRPHARSRADRHSARRADGVRHDDAGRSSPAARARAIPRLGHRLAVHRAGLRRRPDGPRRDAVPARPVVSRESPCTTTCAAGITSRTSGAASSTSSTGGSMSPSPSRPTTSSAPPAPCSIPTEVLTATAAHAPRARADLRRRRRDHRGR